MENMVFTDTQDVTTLSLLSADEVVLVVLFGFDSEATDQGIEVTIRKTGT
jgi:hypothetical protein